MKRTITVCDVTGKEEPTLTTQVGLSRQYDLSHEGALRLIERITQSPLGYEISTAMAAAIQRFQDEWEGKIKADPINERMNELIDSMNGGKVKTPLRADEEGGPFTTPCRPGLALDIQVEEARKRAAWECLEIIGKELDCGYYLSLADKGRKRTAQERVTERIKAAFGL